MRFVCCHHIARYRHQRSFNLIPGGWPVDFLWWPHPRCSLLLSATPSLALTRFFGIIHFKYPKTLDQCINTVPLLQRIEMRWRSIGSLRSQPLRLILVLPAKVCSSTNLFIITIANDRDYSNHPVILGWLGIYWPSTRSTSFGNALASRGRIPGIRAWK